mmetsp:Transcript_76513/g.200722  ORF Transcript_76513/g.200722 Transcript_76513/m.200722 type:complete len:235 (-) Transcript_76513:191-895(-)
MRCWRRASAATRSPEAPPWACAGAWPSAPRPSPTALLSARLASPTGLAEDPRDSGGPATEDAWAGEASATSRPRNFRSAWKHGLGVSAGARCCSRSPRNSRRFSMALSGTWAVLAHLTVAGSDGRTMSFSSRGFAWLSARISRCRSLASLVTSTSRRVASSRPRQKSRHSVAGRRPSATQVARNVAATGGSANERQRPTATSRIVPSSSQGAERSSQNARHSSGWACSVRKIAP